MEDDEVLLENDPLANYLQNLNVPLEFDLEKIKNNESESKKADAPPATRHYYIKHKSYQVYRSCVLSSQLMFSDDQALVLAWSERVDTRYMKKRHISWLLIPLSGVVAYLSKSNSASIIFGSIFLLNTLNVSYVLLKQVKTKSIVSTLMTRLRSTTESMKKYLWEIMQYTTTISYYSTDLNKSTLAKNLNQHAASYCDILYQVTFRLRQKCDDLLALVHLSVQIDNLELIEMREEFITTKHAKILYEYYLLVQSHFLKVLALIFTSELWSSDQTWKFPNVFNELHSLSKFILEKLNAFKKKHETFVRIGTTKRTNPTANNAEVDKSCAALLTNLQLAQINLHELLCKVTDLHESVMMMANAKKERRVEVNKWLETAATIEEIEKQIDNPKHYVNASSIILHRCFLNASTQVETSLEEQTTKQTSDVDESKVIRINPLDPDPPRSNEIYELFIPKEGLPPLEPSHMEDPLLTYNNKTHSTTLLQELKQLLKERNPDIASEQQQVQVECEKETLEKPELFRPIQPVGFVVNQSLQDILAARKTMQDQEEFFEDSFDSDS